MTALLVSACTGRTQERDYASRYVEALSRFPASEHADIEAGMQRFLDVFLHFTEDDISDRVHRAYAQDLFFNDTLVTAEDRTTLAQHLASTGESMKEMEVEILGWSVDEDADVYVRWTMRTRFAMAGREVNARTVGMTHLRFNDTGEIVLHQDFWDASQGFFEQVPMLGGMLRWVRGRL